MAVKPVRTQAKQVAAFVNGVPTRRVQSFDWASNFTIDSVFELGNAGLVEDTITLVETSVTMNSNEWGTTDLEAMVFGIYEQRNILGAGAASKTGIANTTGSIYVAAFGAGGDWTSAVSAGDWLQVIRFNKTGTVNDSEYVKVKTIRYNASSLCNVIGLSPTYLLTAAPATSDLVCLVNNYTITQDTVDSNPVHFVLPHRQSTTATVLMFSTVLPRCYVDNLSYNFDTGGASEQNYTLVGEEEKMFLGAQRETQTVTGSFMSYTSGGGTLTFRVPKDSKASFGTQYGVYAGSDFLKYTGAAGGTITHTGSAATIVAVFPGGLGFDTTTPIVYYFWNGNDNRTGYKGLTNIDNGIGKLSKGYIVIQMQQATGTVEKLQRCTGISISMPLTRESIDELGETRSIAKPLEANIRNEVTLTFNRNNLREFAKLLGYQELFDANDSDPTSLVEILMTELKAVKNITIYAKFYRSQTTHDATTLLKTMTFSSCNFIGQNSTTPISGAAGLELTFSTQSLNIVGSGLPPTYS